MMSISSYSLPREKKNEPLLDPTPEKKKSRLEQQLPTTPRSRGNRRPSRFPCPHRPPIAGSRRPDCYLPASPHREHRGASKSTSSPRLPFVHSGGGDRRPNAASGNTNTKGEFRFFLSYDISLNPAQGLPCSFFISPIFIYPLSGSSQATDLRGFLVPRVRQISYPAFPTLPDTHEQIFL